MHRLYFCRDMTCSVSHLTHVGILRFRSCACSFGFFKPLMQLFPWNQSVLLEIVLNWFEYRAIGKQKGFCNCVTRQTKISTPGWSLRRYRLRVHREYKKAVHVPRYYAGLYVQPHRVLEAAEWRVNKNTPPAAYENWSVQVNTKILPSAAVSSKPTFSRFSLRKSQSGGQIKLP